MLGFARVAVLSKYLQMYPMYRAEALSTPEFRMLITMSRDALATLQKEFPFGLQRADGASFGARRSRTPCQVHGALVLPRTISTNVAESRIKTAVKTKAKKNNNQASFGGSILKANMEVEAAIEMARDLDASGMSCVCLVLDC